MNPTPSVLRAGFRPVLPSTPAGVQHSLDAEAEALRRTPAIWREPFCVRSYEVGPDLRATVQTLMNYFQEAAGNHTSVSLLNGGPESGWVWVMLRFRMRIHRLPTLRSRISAETWACGFRGARAERAFRFVDENGGLLAEGTSYWVTINLERRRPIRPPAAAAAFPVPDLPAPSFADSAPPHPPENTDREVSFNVRRSDLDLNQHVNNVCFLDWALEAIPSSFRETQALTEVDLVFKAESQYGDLISSAVGSTRDGAFLHRLARSSDGRDLAWARTAFLAMN